MLVNARLCMCVKTVQNRSRGASRGGQKSSQKLKVARSNGQRLLSPMGQKTTKKSSHGSPKSSQKGSWRPPGGVQRGSEGTSRRVPPNRPIPGASKNSHFAILGGSKFDFQILNTILDPPKRSPKVDKKVIKHRLRKQSPKKESWSRFLLPVGPTRQGENRVKTQKRHRF